MSRSRESFLTGGHLGRKNQSGAIQTSIPGEETLTPGVNKSDTYGRERLHHGSPVPPTLPTTYTPFLRGCLLAAY